MGDCDQPDVLVCDCSKNVVMVTNLWQKSAKKIGRPHFHSVCWHSTTNGRIATKMGILTSLTTPLHLTNFGPVTPRFAGTFAPGGLHQGVCRTFLIIIIHNFLYRHEVVTSEFS